MILPKLNKEVLSRIFNIYEWPRVTSVTLWMAGLFLMIGLTIKDLSPLVRTYYDDEENTQVQIRTKHMRNDTQKPDLFFCLPLPTYEKSNFTSALLDYLVNGKKCFTCNQMASSAYDVWLRPEPLRLNKTDLETCAGGLNCSANLERALVERIVDSILTKDRKNNRISHEYWSFNRPIIGALVSYLRSETIEESKLLRTIWWSGLDTKPAAIPADVAAEFGIIELNRTIARTVFANKLDRLYSILATFLCEDELFFLQEYKGKTKEVEPEFCMNIFANASLATSLDANTYSCVRLPSELMREEESWIISSHPEYLLRFFTSREPILVTTRNPVRNEIDLLKLPSANLYASSPKLSHLENEDITVIFSQHSSVVEKRPTKLRTCYKESTKEQCEVNSLTKNLESICECRSYLHRKFTKSENNDSVSDQGTRETENEYCDFVDFDHCRQIVENRTFPMDSVTAEPCADACHSNTYLWQVRGRYTSTVGHPVVTLEIKSRRQAYLEFTMEDKDTVEDFVSQIGGVFSYYLGFSGMSIVFVFVYLFNSARRFMRLKKDIIDGLAQPNQQQTSTRNSWLWRWVHLDAPVRASLDAKLENRVSAFKQEMQRELGENLQEMEVMMDSRTDEFRRSMEFLVQNITTVNEVIQMIQCRLDKRVKKRK